MNILVLREKQGLTQADFWSRIGVTQSAGCRYEKHNRPIPEPVLMLLAIAYGRAKEQLRVLAQLRGR